MFAFGGICAINDDLRKKKKKERRYILIPIKWNEKKCDGTNPSLLVKWCGHASAFSTLFIYNVKKYNF